MARSAVHAAAASPLGAADPRQEGPTDLRLVPPALAAWLASAVALGMPGGAAAWTAVVTAVLGAVLLVAGRGRPAAGPAVATATALLCAAAATAVAALHAADGHRGPLPELAVEHARAVVELRITGDPRPTRPHVRGAARAPDAVMVEADAVRVTAHGVTTEIRTPVLVIAETADRPGPGSGRGPEGRPGAGPGWGARSAGRVPAGRGMSASAADPWLGLLPSTRVAVTARIAPPARPGERSAAVLSVRGPPRVIAPPSATQRFAGRLRAGLRTATDGLPPDARALLPGLVVGDTSRLTPELREAFRATDLTHLTAVSGSNLTIVLLLLIGPPGLAIRAERRGLAPRIGIPLRATAVVGGVLTVAFVIVCRPDPSVLRAAACGLITLLAIGTGRRRALLPALAAAVLLLVLYDPWLARSYGFLLSVLATGALLTISPRWSAALRRRGVPAGLAEALGAAGAAQAVCAPVIVVLAGQVSLVAIPCNLLAELAVGPATVLGFGALAAAPFAMPAAEWLAWLAGWPTGWIAVVARRGAALPGAGIGWPGGWGGALLLAALTAAVVTMGRRLAARPWLCAAVALLLLLAVLRPVPLPRVVTGWPPPGWRLAMCDVGQGDSLVLSGAGGSAVVIDAGPEPALADRCLRSLGVTSIALLILTHFHADHVNGLAGVLRGRAVGAIETTTLDEPPEQAAFVRRQAAAARIPVVRAVAGERRRLGALEWQLLWPPATPGALPDNGPNDASVVLLVRATGLTFLLLGDLEPPAQRQLLAAVPDLPRVDVLKVAHHGSAYQDPALLARLGPRLALISCGADNPYGHPAPRTLSALRAQGARVLRTDTDGTVAVLGDRADDLRFTLVGSSM
ncbi:ComEC/Rec2 family competence protein [Streptomyces sp. H39-S7]|uniref:ComEC/Rec2 family competence protein n=1 Tax=Streptomyces sp. H39-S7 TaxID=3004357 RepID=UPI0022B037DC|nr:ComEC/Rec2 family competence protein [Streptomyces sp. H39-S7]MCZ4121409.1 ComEC/Rec2 family competence protein [Streptomyces sp. H39-S7]